MPTKILQFQNAVGEEDLKRIEATLRQTNGVTSVDMDAPIKEFTVKWDERASWRDILRNLEDMGYTPEVERER